MVYCISLIIYVFLFFISINSCEHLAIAKLVFNFVGGKMRSSDDIIMLLCPDVRTLTTFGMQNVICFLHTYSYYNKCVVYATIIKLTEQIINYNNTRYNYPFLDKLFMSCEFVFITNDYKAFEFNGVIHISIMFLTFWFVFHFCCNFSIETIIIC